MASKVFSTVVLGVALSAAVTRAQSNGTTTRYWDCCKQSCGWSGKADVIQPVTSCDASGNQLTDYDAVNGCDGGNAYTCNDNSPWAINDTLAYGFAAVDIAGSSESGWCCQCYELTFTSTAIAGKRMIVQATNTGGDLGNNQFDLLIPGGGVGIFTAGCPAEFGTWNGGATYGGVSNSTQCSQLPADLQAGCNFRFDWMQGVDNPTMSFTPTTCPSELVAKSGCQRNDSGPLTTLSPSNSTSASTSSTTTSSSTASSTTSSTVNSTVSSTSSTDATTTTIVGAGTAVRYAQCAGKGYSGPTVCASPYTCTYQNDYYSQCL